MQPSLKKRILIISGILLIQFNYSIATRVMQGGIIPKLPIDVFPLWVIWVIPYALWYPIITTAGVWLVGKSSERLFREFAAGFLLTCIMGVLTFYFFPTYIIDTPLPGTDIFTKLLILLRAMDGDYAAFPSAHVYVTTSLALFYNRWYPKYGWLCFFIYAMITLSTLFTHQHYILDAVGGTTYAWIGYRFGLWWEERSRTNATTEKATE
ncbi:MAG: phosphatase PAP2 family protein [Anaerolineales bacterium]